MEFNLEQYLKDKGWEVLLKMDKYGQKFTSYVLKKNIKNKDRVFEFELIGEGERPGSIYCKVIEKGKYSIYYIMFEGTLKSYTEFDTIMVCLGLAE
jgi:hypothetical protein